MSSLSEQLKRLSVPQSNILKHDVRKKDSLLFQPSEAAKLSTDVVFTIGVSGLEDLIELDKNSFSEFELNLFSETSQRVQRAVLSKDESRLLDQNIEKFLLRLTPYFLLRSAQKALEWLVYRFYVHQYNVDGLLRLALPYHESNTFIRLIQIVEIGENDSRWAWLIPLKKAQLPLGRQILLNRCISDLGMLGFVCEMVPWAIEIIGKENAAVLDVLFTFYASTVVGVLDVAKTVSDKMVSRVMPYLAQGLQSGVRLYLFASYMIISKVAVQVQLEPNVLKSLLKAILSKMRTDTVSNGLATVLVLCQTQSAEKEMELPAKATMKVIRKSADLLVVEHLANLSEQSEMRHLLTPMARFCLERAREAEGATDGQRDLVAGFLSRAVTETKLSASCAEEILLCFYNEFKVLKGEITEGIMDCFLHTFRPVVQSVSKRHPLAFDKTFPQPWDGKKLHRGKEEFLVAMALDSLYDCRKTRKENVAEEEPVNAAARKEVQAEGIEGRNSEKIVGEEPNRKKKKREDTSTVSAETKMENVESKWWRKTVKRLEQNYQNTSAFDPQEIFSTLEECLRKDGEYYRKEYALQLCLGTLDNICANDTERKVLGTEPVSVRSVVECLRSANSPATHQAALKVLTGLAVVFKNEVIAQVMDVFTFMGTGVVKKDDPYSFQIVQKTLDTVIPALVVTSEIGKDQQNLVETLRIFVAALPDIPQHRRLPLLIGLARAAESKDGGNGSVWLLLGLMLEQHVRQWHKSKETEERQRQEMGEKLKDLLHVEEEFILDFCAQFDPKIQLNAALDLLQYLASVDSQGHGSSVGARVEIFDRHINSIKQLNHFRYLIVGFLANLMSSSQLIAKLSSVGDEAELSTEFGGVFERFLADCLQYLDVFSNRLNAITEDSADRKYWRAIAMRTNLVLNKVNSLIPAGLCVELIKRLLKKDKYCQIRKNVLDLLSSKLQQSPTPFTAQHVPELAGLTLELSGWLASRERSKDAGQNEVGILQLAVFVLKLLVRVVTPFDKEPAQQVLAQITGVLHGWREVNSLLLGSVALCLAEVVTGLRGECLSKIPTMVPDLLEILRSLEGEKNGIVLVSVLTALEKILEHLSRFLSPYMVGILQGLATAHLAASKSPIGSEKQQQAPSALTVYRETSAQRFEQIRTHVAALSGRILLPAVGEAFERLKEESPESLSFIFGVLDHHVRGLSGNAASEELSQTLAILFEMLTLRTVQHKRPPEEMNELEDGVLSCFASLSLKLSEGAFRPLIFRLCEWAEGGRNPEAAGLPPAATERTITFHRLMNRLAGELKNLFVLFAGPLIKINCEVLDRCNFVKTAQSERLFTGEKKKCPITVQKTDILVRSILETITKCCQFDTDHHLIDRERFEMLSTPLLDQLENTSLSDYNDRMERCLLPCVVEWAGSAEDDSALKPANYRLLVKTRHHKARVRLWALRAVGGIYARLGEDVLPLLPETVPFLAEVLEDENEEVEAECRKVIGVLENMLGDSLQQYF